MPLPGSITMVTVTADERRADGTTPAGSVTFIPSVRSTVAGTTITIDPVTVQLVAGQASVPLAWQDDPDLTPHGWTYLVILTVGADSRMWSVKLPQTGPVALDTLAPVDEVVPTIVRVLSVNGILPDSGGDVALPPSQGSAPSSRVIATQSGLQGGGDLTADRTLSPVYGATAGTVCEGSDGRLADARTPLAHTHPQSDVVGLAATLGGKATKLVVRQATVTSGNISLSTGTNTWGPLTGSPTLSIPAAVGDYVNLDNNAFRQTGSNQYLDLGVVVSGQMRRYLGSGTTGTPAAQDPSYEGDSALYHSAGVPSRSAGQGFQVTANDLDAGTVVFVFAVRSTGAGSPLLLASVANPLRWRAVNWGATDFA